MKTAKLYTKDQTIGFLVDEALFSDSTSARIRAITKLSREGSKAIPIIEGIIKILPVTDKEFRTYCIGVIAKIKEHKVHPNRAAGLPPIAKFLTVREEGKEPGHD
jgi:hypothetical protein